MDIKDQIKEANRELGIRQRVYPNWTASGKLKHEIAQHRIDAMAAIVKTLEQFEKEHRTSEQIGLGLNVSNSTSDYSR